METKQKLVVETDEGYVAGILYLTQLSIKQVTTNSGPLANHNEYQVHWEGLTYRLSLSDTDFIDITIPTVIYNYPQVVGPSTIEFELKDVQKVRETIKPLANLKETEVIAKFKAIYTLASEYGLTVKLINNAMSNIHRHPGSMSSFSGTDYDTNPDNPGIVFPLKSACLAGIYSSIIIHGPIPHVSHTEYRVANTTDNKITYYKGACFTYCKGYELEVPELYKRLLTTKTMNETYTLENGDKFNTEFISKLTAIFDNVNYEPDTRCVVPTNLETKKHVITKYDTSSFKYKSLYDDNDDITYVTTTQKGHTSHVGKPPLLANLVAYQNSYGHKIFTTKYGKFLGNDIVDAWMDYEYTAQDSPINEPKTIEDFLTLLNKEGTLELYKYPYQI